ncbi:polysaccharide deacetylase [Nakamurella sp. A5-74]|uniref:Polysaccharide deacetylase n=1 Tax=Nakamurella sp. A5-74 TaxID=3158264 RepID=A0AAU8DNG2_9ACTN
MTGMSATRRYVGLSAALVFAVITGVLVYQGRTPPPTAAAVAASGPSSSAPRTPAAPARKATNLPMRKLKPGEKAPQLIIFSFDGAGDHEKWQEFMAAAKPTDSRFNGFLTGTYLLTDENKAKYTGPGHAAGKSSVGFGGTAADLKTRINDLNTAYAAGHEIGLHYNGHFCAGAEPSAAAWSTADWTDEIGQFLGFLKNYRANNPEAKNLPALKVPASSIKGGRTPCLEGQWDQLVPAWKKAGLSYDSSMNAPTSGISWPEQVDGIWEFYMPYVYSPGFDGMVVNMDYNMWVKFNGGANDASSAPVLRDKVYQTYKSLFDATWNGNRAPLLIANHFNTWNGNSFNPSVLKFMTNYCGRKDVHCTTYSDAIAWMKLQDPKVLAALQAQPAVAAEKP